MVAPDQESEQGDRDRGERHRRISEQLLLREGRHQLRDDAHGRQNHDVDRWVRVEPEEVLKKDGISAECRVENADPDQALQK